MNRFNLSDWALQHRSFVWFLMIVSIVAGAIAYTTIGREEDPNFAIKTMVIATSCRVPMSRKRGFRSRTGSRKSWKTCPSLISHVR